MTIQDPQPPEPWGNSSNIFLTVGSAKKYLKNMIYGGDDYIKAVASGNGKATKYLRIL